MRIRQVLTGVAQWAGCHPTKRKVTSPIPGQDTSPGCGPGPASGVCNHSVSISHINVSLPKSLPSPLSIHKHIKYLLRRTQK